MTKLIIKTGTEEEGTSKNPPIVVLIATQQARQFPS